MRMRRRGKPTVGQVYMWPRNKSRKAKREGRESNPFFAEARQVAVSDSRPFRRQSGDDFQYQHDDEVPPKQVDPRILEERKRATAQHSGCSPTFENLRSKRNAGNPSRRTMDQKSKNGTETRKAISKEELLISCSEIRTAQDFARFMATMMAALIAGEIRRA